MYIIMVSLRSDAKLEETYILPELIATLSLI
jgi:hypothetical protein